MLNLPTAKCIVLFLSPNISLVKIMLSYELLTLKAHAFTKTIGTRCTK